MSLIEQLGGYEKAKLIVSSALDFTHIDIYDGFEYFIYEKQNGNGDINDVLTFNPRLNRTGSAFVQGGLDKYGGWHIGINEIKTALLEYRRQHNIFESEDKIVVKNDCLIEFADLTLNLKVLTVLMVTNEGFIRSIESAGLFKSSLVRHATPEEIAAGRRL